MCGDMTINERTEGKGGGGGGELEHYRITLTL